MKGKKFLSLVMTAVLCGSLLAACGSSTETSTEAESSVVESVVEESSEEVEEVVASTDPLEMITEGYYSFTYPVDGMDDMCAFFHFYEEQPVLGSVFYAGFAWNQITYAGTYTVEETPIDYKVSATREEAVADPVIYQEGTAPYTVTFYDFDGNELGACGFDGDILYNDSPISGTGAADCYFTHDTDADSKYMSTYEGEIGIAYMDFVANDDATSTLSLYHNGRYMDLVGMMIEGNWTMEDVAEGYAYTLTPDYESDTAAALTVSADKTSGVYTPDGGEGVEMTNTLAGGPTAVYELTGETPIPGMDFNGALIGTAYDDGTITLIVDVYGTTMDLDKGYWSLQDGELAISFDNTDPITTETKEDGSQVLHYVGTNEMLGDVDVELVVAEAAGEAAPAFTVTGAIPFDDSNNYDVTGTLYDDGTVVINMSIYGNEGELDRGTYTMENYVFTFNFENAGELVSGFGDAGAVLQYVNEGAIIGPVDTELVIGMPE